MKRRELRYPQGPETPATRPSPLPAHAQPAASCPPRLASVGWQPRGAESCRGALERRVRARASPPSPALPPAAAAAAAAMIGE